MRRRYGVAIAPVAKLVRCAFLALPVLMTGLWPASQSHAGAGAVLDDLTTVPPTFSVERIDFGDVSTTYPGSSQYAGVVITFNDPVGTELGTIEIANTATDWFNQAWTWGELGAGFAIEGKNGSAAVVLGALPADRPACRPTIPGYVFPAQTETIRGKTYSAGEKCTFAVGFHPRKPGHRTAWATVSWGWSIYGGSKSITLTGNGAEPGKLTFDRADIVFGRDVFGRVTPVEPGTRSAAQSVALKNDGDQTVSLTGLRTSGDFVLVSTDCPSGLPDDARCNASVAFAPTTAGPHVGSLQALGAGGAAILTLPLSGVASSPVQPPIERVLLPKFVTSGMRSTGRVVFAHAAPAIGTDVTFTSSNPTLLDVAGLRAEGGADGVRIPIEPGQVSASTAVTLTASTADSSASATLTIRPSTVGAVGASPGRVVSGSATQGTVFLTGPAPASGLVISLLSGDVGLLRVPATVTIAAGARAASFDIDTSVVPQTTCVGISAFGPEASAGTTVVLTPSLAAPGAENIFDLGVGCSGESVGALDVNNNGQVLIRDVSDEERYFVLHDADLQYLARTGRADPHSQTARALNDVGDIVGESGFTYEEGLSPVHAFIRNGGGPMFDLGSTPPEHVEHTWANGLSESGVVVGGIITFVPESGITERRGAMWDGGRMRILDVLEPLTSGEAFDVNIHGDAVGRSHIYAVRWSRGDLTALTEGAATAINDRGEIVGWRPGAGGRQEGFVWTPSTGVTSLPPLPGSGREEALAVNELGQVVGEAVYPGAGESDELRRAVLWQDGVAIDLNSFLPEGSKWWLERAVAINDRGQIVGEGTLDGQPRSFLLNPGAVTGAPAPVLSSISPHVGLRGGADFTLTVRGRGFTPASTVRWNGTPRATTYLNATTLTAQVPARDLVSAADISSAVVRVSTPTPGGGLSNPLGFAITGPLVADARTVIAAPNATAGTVVRDDAATLEAALINNGSTGAAALTLARYTGNPTGVVFEAGTFFDLQVSGASADDRVSAQFAVHTTDPAIIDAAPSFRWFDGTTWQAVLSSGGDEPVFELTFDENGVVDGGYFSVVFDATSTPSLADLSGTVFGLDADAATPNEDTVAPSLTPPGAISVGTNTGCTYVGAIGAATATDNVSSGTSLTITNDAPAAFPLGTTTVTWRATDAAGNFTTATQQVTVVDDDAPTLTPPAAVALGTNSGAAYAGAIGAAAASDNCSTGASLVITNDAPATFPLGVTTVTWRAADAAGNSASATQQVTVVDDDAPSLTAPADIAVGTNSGCTFTGGIGSATATDNVSSGPALTITNDAPSAFPLGTTTVTWRATDTAGNVATATQRVIVTDDDAPSIAPPAAITLGTNVGATYVGAIGTATASDNCSTGASLVITSDAPAAFPLGTTTVTWRAADAAGNFVTATQQVTIFDDDAPSITAPADVTLRTQASCDATGDIGRPTVTDNASSGPALTITNDAPSTFPLGTTTVTWRATDAAGNSATATQRVTVVDLDSPSVRPPANVTVTATSASGATVDAATLGTATATDACGVIGIVASGIPAGNLFPIGTTTVTWRATDASGNTATASQTVTVQATAQCPATIRFPIAILNEDGSVRLLATLEGTEQAVGTRCAVTYRLIVRGFTVGSGTFMADHPAPGVTLISDGTLKIGSITTRLTFAGTVDLNEGTAVFTTTFGSTRSWTTRMRFYQTANGEFVITSVNVSRTT